MPRQKGRPNQAMILARVEEGRNNPSLRICPYCDRSFVLQKSLNVHVRTHTGETPYQCDYPRCGDKFKQSGQLKTHLYIHTGEKLFICRKPGCGVRWKHSNRFCPNHKEFGVMRDGKEEVIMDENLPEDEKLWLRSYIRNKKCSSQGIKRPAENDSDEENIPVNNKRTSDDKYRNKKNNSRGTKRPSAENDSDEENVPVNNKKISDDGYSSDGSSSSSSSSISNECDESVLAAAQILMHIKNRSFNCGTRFTHSNQHCPVRDPLRDSKVIRDGNKFIDVKEDNISEEQKQCLQKNKKYNSRGIKRPAENDSDEENIPVNNRRTSDDEYISAGSSSSSSSFCKYDKSDMEAVHSLLLLNYGNFL